MRRWICVDKFGKKLKKLRMDNNVSAYKLCEDLHIHRGTLSNWETGKRTPDSDTLLKIANYFNVTLDYLLGNEKGKRKKYNSSSSWQVLIKWLIGPDQTSDRCWSSG